MKNKLFEIEFGPYIESHDDWFDIGVKIALLIGVGSVALFLLMCVALFAVGIISVLIA